MCPLSLNAFEKKKMKFGVEHQFFFQISLFIYIEYRLQIRKHATIDAVTTKRYTYFKCVSYKTYNL